MEEQQHPSISTRKQSAFSPTTTRWLVGSLILAIVAVGSFSLGSHYQKNHDSSMALSSSGGPMGSFAGGMGGPRMNGGIGTVTTVSSSSISVTDERSGSSKTYSIDSSTTITDNGSAADTSAIKAGDRVLIQTSGSTSTAATRIVVNPSFGGPPGDDSGQSSSGSNDSSI